MPQLPCQTCPSTIPWDQDGKDGAPSSFDILMEWLARNQNNGYLRWITSGDRDRRELCSEIIAELNLLGIHHRSGKCIHLKMFMMINSYQDACKNLSDHGGLLSKMHPKYGTVEGLMHRICPHWSRIHHIMAPHPLHLSQEHA
ncbi:hypothetical protein PSTT_11880 [Puccinia striiformis]|uniref:Uncharacterized protein n=1 Tax=Puccinia striiformis TaxID=27350 RepID=A0A2S4UYH7_9BASI|nr:hypothetical protein PSTT_11880 [Puccinia striiformis]